MSNRVGPLAMALGMSLAMLVTGQAAQAADAKVVLVAGRPSHGPGEHEFNAGSKLLEACLKQIPGIEPVLVTGGWPADTPAPVPGKRSA